MIQTILFDLDGTLLNTLEDLADAGNYVCRKNGWPEHTLEEYRQMVGHGIPNLVERFSPEDNRSPLLLMSTLSQFSTYYGKHNLDKTLPYAGIPQALSKLKAQGFSMAVFSNKADEFSREIAQHFFPGIFDVVRGKLSGVPVKPHPAGVLRLMEELGADPLTTIFVGDSDVDAQTGHNAGLPVCGVTWGFRSRAVLEQEQVEKMVDSPAEMETWLIQQRQEAHEAARRS